MVPCPHHPPLFEQLLQPRDCEFVGPIFAYHARPRVAKLYGAGKLFACRHCYRLGYAVQRSGPLDRAHPPPGTPSSQARRVLPWVRTAFLLRSSLIPWDQNQWVMASHDYANTRFSGLDQINPGNAAQLQLAWTFSVGADRGQEAAPLIVNNTMYVVGPYAGQHPNQVFALDATTGDLKWSYAPQPNTADWANAEIGIRAIAPPSSSSLRRIRFGADFM